MRRSISPIGTGLETSAYSLQYAQARLQRRMGTIWAITGCRVEASAWPTRASSRTRRLAAFRRRPIDCGRAADMLFLLKHRGIQARDPASGSGTNLGLNGHRKAPMGRNQCPERALIRSIESTITRVVRS